MGTPARKLILDNIGTVLNTITTGNGYKTDVTKVQALARGYADVKTGERPFLGYVPELETVEYLPFNHIRCTLTVRIIGHVSGQSQNDRSTKLNNLIDDIIAAVNLDPTRGTNAINTKMGQFQTDEGDPDGRGDGSVLTTLSIVYERSTSST